MSEFTMSMEQQHPMIANMLRQKTPTEESAYLTLETVNNKQIAVKEESSIVPPDECSPEPCENESTSTVNNVRQPDSSDVARLSNAPPLLSLQIANGSIIYYGQVVPHRQQIQQLKEAFEETQRQDLIEMIGTESESVTSQLSGVREMTGVLKDEVVYELSDENPRGFAVIVNIKKGRQGSEKDVAMMKTLFTDLCYDVKIVEDESKEVYILC